MTENEKAAIAAGLHRASDMHDPANLWRALENRALNVMWANDKVIVMDCCAELAIATSTKIADATFAALVALYDAEHPEEKAGAVTVG